MPGKFFLLMAGAGKGNYLLITIASLNMIISFYYYLRIVKTMFMDKNETPIEKINIPVLPKIGLLICLVGIIIIGLDGDVYQYIYDLSLGF